MKQTEETVSRAGKKMASLVRAYTSGQQVDEMEVWDAFARMAQSDAATATDALALVSVAKIIMGQTLEDMRLSAESIEGFSLYCALTLMEKAAVTLEGVTGQRETEFTGRAPAIN